MSFSGRDEDSDFVLDDIVEVFIRANSGGTKLSKSDLMFTLLVVDWEDADLEMQEFLSDFEIGKKHNRYMEGDLPHLSFKDN